MFDALGGRSSLSPSLSFVLYPCASVLDCLAFLISFFSSSTSHIHVINCCCYLLNIKIRTNENSRRLKRLNKQLCRSLPLSLFRPVCSFWKYIMEPKKKNIYIKFKQWQYSSHTPCIYLAILTDWVCVRAYESVAFGSCFPFYFAATYTSMLPSSFYFYYYYYHITFNVLWFSIWKMHVHMRYAVCVRSRVMKRPIYLIENN